MVYTRRMKVPTVRIALLLTGFVLAGCRSVEPRPVREVQPGRRLDPAAATRDEKQGLLWYDVRHMTVEGKGWTEAETFYSRLPAKAEAMVREPVWKLAQCSAGLCVRFVTDSDRIAARWTTTSASMAMDHMAATGVSGLDLYIRTGGQWHWLATGRPRKSLTNEGILVGGIPAGVHEYLLYLPLYNGTRSLEIGVNEQAMLAHPGPLPPGLAKPVVIYGTSITQGGCASRPGMSYVAIIGRRLDRPTINLGFSGNGKMERELATLLGEIDAAAYVLDCLPNMTADMVSGCVVPFVESLRQARPTTPIVLVASAYPENAAILSKSRETIDGKNEKLRQAYQALVERGVDGLTFVPPDRLASPDGEATVDGVHPTDLGFLRFAEVLTPILERVLDTMP